MKNLLMVVLALFLCTTPVLCAVDEPVPAIVDASHWTCREICALADRYGATGKLPEQLKKGGTATRRELAQALLVVMEEAVKQCEVSGQHALPPDESDRIARLQAALQSELDSFEGYLNRKEAIARILSKPEEPAFLYKYGVTGFLRGGAAHNMTFSDGSVTPKHGEGQGVFRIKPYVYWHPTDWLDLHLEGQGYGYAGGSFQGGEGRESRFGLYQGFVIGRLPGSELASLKVGRQELVYGSAFLLGADGFHDGRVYDAVKLTVTPWSPLSLDVFTGQFVHRTADPTEGTMTGAYLTYTLREGTALDLYAVRDTGSTDHHSGEERYSWGVRGAAKIGPVSCEIESLLQSGHLFNPGLAANENIRAYGGHADVRYEFDMADYHNALFAAYAYGSGSQDAADGTSARKEFANPYNDSGLVESYTPAASFSGIDAGAVHASGIDLFVGGWGIDLTKELNFTATYRHFQARNVPAGVSDEIGQETSFVLNWALNDKVSVVFDLNRFYPGRLYTDAGIGRKDVTTAYAMLQFNVAQLKPR